MVSFLPRFPCSSGWRGDGGGKCSSRTVQYIVTTHWKVRILSAYFLSDNVHVKWQEVCFLAFNPKRVIQCSFKCSLIVSRIILTTQTHVMMPLFLQFKAHEFVSKIMRLKVPYYTYFQIFIFPPGFQWRSFATLSFSFWLLCTFYFVLCATYLQHLAGGVRSISALSDITKSWS